MGSELLTAKQQNEYEAWWLDVGESLYSDATHQEVAAIKE
jgi:hypothetical protein